MLGEAIGDLAGAKLAYRAREISRRGEPPAPAEPFGLSVVSINIGKHIDKSVEDKKKKAVEVVKP